MISHGIGKFQLTHKCNTWNEVIGHAKEVIPGNFEWTAVFLSGVYLCIGSCMTGNASGEWNNNC